MSFWKFDLMSRSNQTWLEKLMLHISRSVSSSWTHQRCFHCFSLSLSRVIAEKLLVTSHDLIDAEDMRNMCGKDVSTGVLKRRRGAVPFFEIPAVYHKGCPRCPVQTLSGRREWNLVKWITDSAPADPIIDTVTLTAHNVGRRITFPLK